MTPGVAVALFLGAAAVGATGRRLAVARGAAVALTALALGLVALTPAGAFTSFGGLSFHASAFGSAAVLAAGLALAATTIAAAADRAEDGTGNPLPSDVLVAIPLGLAAVAVCGMVADTLVASSTGGGAAPSDGSALAAVLVAASASAAALAARSRDADRRMAPTDGGGPVPGAAVAGLDLVVLAAASAALVVLGSALVPGPGAGATADTAAFAPAFLLVAAAVGVRYGIVPFHRSLLRALGEMSAPLVPLLAAWLPAAFLLAVLAWTENAFDPVGAVLPDEVRIATVLVAAVALAGGAVAATRESDVTRLVGCLLVSDGGFALLALAGGPEARETARVWIVVNAVARTALCAWASALHAAAARNRLTATAGWARALPSPVAAALAVTLVIVAVATVGLPGWRVLDARAVLVDLASGWPLRAVLVVAAWSGVAGFARLAYEATRRPGLTGVTQTAGGERAPVSSAPPDPVTGTAAPAVGPVAPVAAGVPDPGRGQASEAASPRPALGGPRASATGIRWSGEARIRTEPTMGGGRPTGPLPSRDAASVPTVSAGQEEALRLRPRPRSPGASRRTAAGRRIEGVRDVWMVRGAEISVLAAASIALLAALLSSGIVPLGESGPAASGSAPAPASAAASAPASDATSPLP